MIEHAKNEPAPVGAPQIERSSKTGGVRIMTSGIYMYEEESAQDLYTELVEGVERLCEVRRYCP